jgi:hypothetical protein
MTVEADIFAALKDLVSNRVYPDEAPIDATTPYIVYQQVGGDAQTFLERALPSKENARFQFSVWSPTRVASKAMIKQVEDAMVAATAFDAKPIGAPVSASDSETQLRGSMQDFSVWSDR